MVNDARRKLAVDCGWNESIKSYSSTAYKGIFTMPTDYIRARRVLYITADSQIELTQVESQQDFAKQDKVAVNTNTLLSDYYISGTTLNVWPPLSAAADTDQLNGGINASVTTIVLDDATELSKAGRILIENEKISYAYRDDTTLYGCTRGIEGTTAATHADDTAITELDIWVYYDAFPADKVVGDNVDYPFELFPNALVYYLCWQAKVKDMDDGGGFDGARAKADYFRQLFEIERAGISLWVQSANDETWSIRDV
jgi:hypothetical protein